MKTIPGYLDRYPAKMVTSLADKIIDNYVDTNSVILDPFCGSGAILKASQKKSCKTYGIDINPYAILLSKVKLNGFNPIKAKELLENIICKSLRNEDKLTTTYDNISYWFTPKTLEKLYKLRYYLKHSIAETTNEGLAVLLAFALSIRLVSKADQRSPKPFISKTSREKRKGKHYDPFLFITRILSKLSEFYGTEIYCDTDLSCSNVVNTSNYKIEKGTLTHIITSPPYINAQDYFRNSKLELFFLEGLLPFSIQNIKNSFIGSEGGCLDFNPLFKSEHVKDIASKIGQTNIRLSKVVLKYFSDMETVLDNTYDLLTANGNLILVCGDNVVAGYKIDTWKILNELAECRGYQIIGGFKDKILKRSLAPVRMGHKSLIKDEVVTVFKKN